MQLIKQGKVFVAVSSYDERTMPKQAGFLWHGGNCRSGCSACEAGLGKVWWTARAENAAKLKQYATPEALAAIAGDDRVASIEASKQTDSVIDVPAPAGLSYLPFQKAGIAYALARPGTLFGDEMGLGKTIQAIGVVNASPDAKRVLVICPASLKLNWRRELERWLTRPMTIGIADGKNLPTTDVVVVNYDVLHKHAEALRAVEWDVLIADECHLCKSAKARRTQQVVGSWDRKTGQWKVEPLKAKRRLFLTGTPIVNRPIEAHTIISSLTPEFRNFFGYAKRYCNAHETRFGWDFSGASHLDELQDRLRATVMVRRLKSQVLTELPAKRRQVIEIPQNGCGKVVASEKTAWDSHEAAIMALRDKVELAKAGDDQDYSTAVSELTAGMRAAFTEISKIRHETAVAKIPAVVEHLQSVLEEGSKVVVFAHHHDVVDALMDQLKDSNPVKLDGTMGMEARQASVDRFQNDPTCKVFVGSITAAGVGITLTAASHVVFAELDWVPGNMSQAEDRLHRIGQTQSVLVQHLVLEGSLDATMARILVAKQEVIDSALDRNAPEIQAVLTMPTIPGAGMASDVSRKDVVEEAVTISSEQVSAVREALRMLAGVCDGAMTLDGAGFNKFDARLGHDLANRGSLTARQAVLGRKICKKYVRQLGTELVARMG